MDIDAFTDNTMAGQKNNDHPDRERRNFLGTATKLVAGAGIAAASWPFISSMNPSTNILARASTEVDISGIAPGEVRTIEWQGKPVFVFHRTAEQISTMSASTGSSKDPAADEQRVLKPEWLVVVGICTHLGCVPTRKAHGWVCPCHGSVYDNSGRILKGPAPRNLDLPPYEFTAEDKIFIKKA